MFTKMNQYLILSASASSARTDAEDDLSYRTVTLQVVGRESGVFLRH